MIKTITIILIVLLFLSIGTYFIYNYKYNNKEDKLQYQGPVPQGYDEQYFRETGITKIEGDN